MDNNQQHGSIDPLRMQADQSHSLEEAKAKGEAGVATLHTSAIHIQLEGSGSFDDWKTIVLSLYDESSSLPF